MLTSLLLCMALPTVTPVAVFAHPTDDMVAQDAARVARNTLGERALGGVTLDQRLQGVSAITDAAFDAHLQRLDDAFASGDGALLAKTAATEFDVLSRDANITMPRFARLQDARVQTAQRLLGLAGAAEKGKGQTDIGKAAKLLVRQALTAAPTMALSATQYPPKLRTMVAAVADELKSAPAVTLQINREDAADSEIFVDGRSLGKAPLRVPLPPGRYRVWGQQGSARSVVHVVDLVSGTTVVPVDVSFDVGVQPSRGQLGPGIAAGTPLTDALLTKLRARMGTDIVVVTHVPGATAVVYSSSTRSERAAARDDAPDVAASVAGLVPLLVDQQSSGGVKGDPSLLPADFFPQTNIYSSSSSVASTGVVSDDEAPFPWVPVLIGTGAAVVVAGVVTGVVVFAVTRTPTARVGLSFCEVGATCPGN
jgi:hypothetical protein